jgi:hypothetical protein
MWEAKNIDMDTGCGFDTQFMVGAGVVPIQPQDLIALFWRNSGGPNKLTKPANATLASRGPLVEDYRYVE